MMVSGTHVRGRPYPAIGTPPATTAFMSLCTAAARPYPTGS